MENKNENARRIDILLLEDSPEDAELIANRLRIEGIEFNMRTVDSGDEYERALSESSPDIILSDYRLPLFDGAVALAIAHEKYSEIPFIFVTGTIGAEKAVETLRKGATDFVLKGNLSRLGPAVRRAIKEKNDMRERHLLLAALKENDERYRSLNENLPVGIFRITASQPGRFLHANLALARMYGIDSVEELIRISLADLYAGSSEYARLLEDIMERGSIKNREIIYKTKNGETIWGSITAACHRNSEGKIDWIEGIIEDVTERVNAETELRRSNEELDLLIKSLGSIIIGVSIKDRITHFNPFAEKLFGIKARDILGKQLIDCAINWNQKIIYEAISACITGDKMVRLDDVRYIKLDGKDGLLGLTVNPLKRGGDVLEGFIILGMDITERRILENQLLQAHKLEAIGQLAAGVAHEINSPMQYVGDNINFIAKSYAGYRELQEKYEELMLVSGKNAETGQLVESIREIEKRIDKQYLQEEMPKAISQSIEGVERISKIVKSMKAFAHPGTDRKTPADINQSIENTITVSRNEWKYAADVETEFDKNLVPVPCFAAELNQVILNMIVNATDAIKESLVKKIIAKGIIRISTKMINDFAEIRVADNGIGIPEEIRQKVFDPFFTTKEVGKGTGQGLSIAYAIIVTKHGGTLRFETETGRGTVFIIRLPLADTQESMYKKGEG